MAIKRKVVRGRERKVHMDRVNATRQEFLRQQQQAGRGMPAAEDDEELDLPVDDEEDDDEADDEELDDQVEDETDDTDDEDPDSLLAPMDFDGDFREVPVTIRNPETGEKEKFVLRECDGGSKAKYMTLMRKKASFDAAGNPTGLKDFEGVESGLVALCLFREGEEDSVSVREVEAMPGHIQEGLFLRCQKLCGLDKKAKKRAKNS